MKKSHISKAVKIFNSSLRKFEEFVLIFGILSIAAISIANTLGRNYFNYNFMWGEEYCQSVILFMISFGTAYAARRGRHVRMSAIFDVLPHNYKKMLIIIVSFITSATMFYLAYLSYCYAMKMKLEVSVLPILRIPWYYILIWVPIGLTIAGIEFAVTVGVNLSNKEIFLSSELKDGYEEEIIGSPEKKR